MGNSLPVKLKSVHYYLISGIFSDGYNWAGDLIITKKFIYYFPVRDLVKERKEIERAFPIGGLIGFVAQELALYFRRDQTFFENLHSKDESDEELSARLEEYFMRKKFAEPGEIFSYPSDTLPNPMRFESKDVQNMKLSRGQLHFKTIADQHDFKFGNKDTEQIQEALLSGEFPLD